MRRAVIVALLVFLTAATPVVGGESGSLPGGAAADATAPDDPETDTVGWEDGYWYDEAVDVDQSDGLSDAELERYVARAMARVEHLREREFERHVNVSIISRETYRNRTRNRTRNGAYGEWNNQVWEALFIVGEDTDVQSALGSTLGGSVAGFYDPRTDEIKIITSTPEEPIIDNATLHHELVHALQDQYYNLSSGTYRADTQDGGLAVDGVVEGEANYLETQYSQRCASGEWDCVASPGGGGGGGDVNLGIFLTLFQPYADGPAYVHDLYQQGGWGAVDHAMEAPPASTEQVIHLTDDAPTDVAFTDRARNGWGRYTELGVNGSDTVGEASIYAMFWYQSRTYDAGVVDTRELFDAEGEYDLYNYSAPPSAGWDGDRVFPYNRGDDFGYVWVSEWDTAADAREFAGAYRDLLATHGATERVDGVYVIGSDDPWADAFRVHRRGARVTVVNGPDSAAVDDLRPNLARATTTVTAATTTTASATTTERTARTTTTLDTTTTDRTTSATATDTTAETPGFGGFPAVLAVGAAALLALRRA